MAQEVLKAEEVLLEDMQQLGVSQAFGLAVETESLV
jgi:hypothetical protein